MPIERDARFWQSELDMASKHERKWRKRARRVIARYRDDDPDSAQHFNILWANTETQKPALYSATPKPVVKRRHRQEGTTSRLVSQMLERSLKYAQDPGGAYDFDRVGQKLILDYLLPGRMICRVKYHPITTSQVRQVATDVEPENSDFTIDDSGKFLFEEKYDELVDEEVRAYHVPFDQYRQAVADHWEDVWWVAFGNNFLTREEVIDQFGPEHADVPMRHIAHTEDRDGDFKEGESREIKKAQVWEIWDRDERRVYAVVEGYDRLLMDEEDPLRLRGFYPMPEPVNIVESPNTLIPVPEFALYQQQADELNMITQRIENLVKAMKLAGLYPGSQKDLIRELVDSEENTLVPVEDWAAITERGGLNGMIEWIPLRDVADAWQRLMVYRQTLVQSIFELTGISDIQRGATDPRETKGAQQLKAGFANRRLLPKQQDVQRYFRDIFRIQSEIIAEHFQTETIAGMAQLPVTEDVMAAREIMRDDALRSFAIDIETDSTIAPDEQAEKQGVAEFVSAMSNFMAQAFPIIQAQPAAMAPLGKMMMWMTRKFRIARDAEDELESFLEMFGQLPDRQQGAEQQAMAEAQQKMQMEQAQMQMKAQETQAELQLKAQTAQADTARKDRESDAKIAREQEMHRLDVQKAQLDLQLTREKIALAREEAEAKVMLSAVDQQQKRLQDASKPAETKSEASQTAIKVEGGNTGKKRIKLVKGKDGKVEGAEITPVEDKKSVSFERDQEGRIAGAEIE